MNNDWPKISIIVPIYGVELYIEDCLRSIIAQDYSGELECILVNDYTPDNSMKVAESILSDYNGNIQFVIINHEKNQGLSAARNSGINIASGEYIYFLDSDDEITSDCCSVLAKPLLNKKYEMVIANYQTMGTDKKFPSLSLPEGECLGHDAIANARYNGLWYQMAINKLYNKNFIIGKNLSFKENLIHEDELWSAELACILESMYTIPSRNTYIYKIRENSITTANNYQRKKQAFYTILSELNNFLQTRKLQKDKNSVKILLSMFYIFTLIIFEHEGKSEYNKFYVQARDLINISYTTIAKVFGFHSRQQLRNLHFIMPSGIAKNYYRILSLHH